MKEYKKKIDKELNPSRAFRAGGPKASILRKIISDFKKIAVFQIDVIELILYRVELAIAFSDEFGDIDEPFYNSLENAFKDACKIIEKEKLFGHFAEQLRSVVDSTCDTGWGLHDGMSYIYEDYFGPMRFEV